MAHLIDPPQRGDAVAAAGGDDPQAPPLSEPVQNIENEHWSEKEVNAKLKEKMESATDAVLQMQLEIKDRHGAEVDLRTAAFALAIKRVASVAAVRGIWP